MNIETAINGNATLVGLGTATGSDFSHFTVGNIDYSLGTLTTNYPYGYWYCQGHSDNKVERSYQIIRALMRAKVIKVKDLEDFFLTMDEVQKAL